MWGDPKRLIRDTNDETFLFFFFAKATIFSIDEDGKEERVLGFTLFPKISADDFFRMNGAAKLDWHNIVVYPDGALKALDSSP
jgi:hypothetical protein